MSQPVVVVTGHRPLKLGGYEVRAANLREDFAATVLEPLQPKVVVIGMALGWDMAVGLACLRLGIPYHAYIPFEGQHRLWNEHDQRVYFRLRKNAEAEVLCSNRNQYWASVMKVRNGRMLEVLGPGDLLLANWDGGSSGGTADCIRQFRRMQSAKPANEQAQFRNVWEQWWQYYGTKHPAIRP